MDKNDKSKIALTVLGVIAGAIIGIFVTYMILGHTSNNPELEKIVSAIDAECPQQVDEATTLEHFVVDGDFAVYEYSVKGMSVDSINPTALNNNLIQASILGSEQQKQFFSLVAKSGKGIRYEYKDEAGKVLKVDFTEDELEGILEKNK